MSNLSTVVYLRFPQSLPVCSLPTNDVLVEADFLVNASEDQMSDVQIINFAKNIFKTKSGINILRLLFPHLEFLI